MNHIYVGHGLGYRWIIDEMSHRCIIDEMGHRTHGMGYKWIVYGS